MLNGELAWNDPKACAHTCTCINIDPYDLRLLGGLLYMHGLF